MSREIEPEEVKQYGDDARLELALQTIKDVLWRYEEGCEGRHTLYEVIACLLEDLIREGICSACINEVVSSVFDVTGADPVNHNDDEESVYH